MEDDLEQYGRYRDEQIAFSLHRSVLLSLSLSPPFSLLKLMYTVFTSFRTLRPSFVLRPDYRRTLFFLFFLTCSRNDDFYSRVTHTCDGQSVQKLHSSCEIENGVARKMMIIIMISSARQPARWILRFV